MEDHIPPLHRVISGRGHGRVVLAHGFTQTMGSWEAVGERLGERWEVMRVDLPGHGGSGGVRVGFEEAAGLVGAAGGSAAYVGYSLGGRLCLRLALDRPDLVPALVLIGASPGIAEAGGRAERRAADEALAERIERHGVAAFLDRWLAGSLFATLPEAAAGRAERLANTADGLACGPSGPAPRSRSGTGWPACAHPPCCWPASWTASSPPSPARWPPPSARPPRSPSSREPATPPTSSARPRWPPASRRSWPLLPSVAPTSRLARRRLALGLRATSPHEAHASVGAWPLKSVSYCCGMLWS
jgi:alpha/beta hydrolase fold